MLFRSKKEEADSSEEEDESDASEGYDSSDVRSEEEGQLREAKEFIEEEKHKLEDKKSIMAGEMELREASYKSKKKKMGGKDKDMKKERKADLGGGARSLSARKPMVPPAPKGAMALFAKNAASMVPGSVSGASADGGGSGGGAAPPEDVAAEYSMASALDSVEVHAEGKRSETADLFQYKVRPSPQLIPQHPTQHSSPPPPKIYTHHEYNRSPIPFV